MNKNLKKNSQKSCEYIKILVIKSYQKSLGIDIEIDCNNYVTTNVMKIKIYLRFNETRVNIRNEHF